MISYKLHILHTEICTTAFQGCGWLLTEALSFGAEDSGKNEKVEEKLTSKKNKESKKQK